MRTKLVNGVRVTCTPEEEAELDAREAQWAAEAPRRQIEKNIDSLPERLRAIFDALSATRQSNWLMQGLWPAVWLAISERKPAIAKRVLETRSLNGPDSRARDQMIAALNAAIAP